MLAWPLLLYAVKPVIGQYTKVVCGTRTRTRYRSTVPVYHAPSVTHYSPRVPQRLYNILYIRLKGLGAIWTVSLLSLEKMKLGLPMRLGRHFIY